MGVHCSSTGKTNRPIKLKICSTATLVIDRTDEGIRIVSNKAIRCTESDFPDSYTLMVLDDDIDTWDESDVTVVRGVLHLRGHPLSVPAPASASAPASVPASAPQTTPLLRQNTTPIETHQTGSLRRQNTEPVSRQKTVRIVDLTREAEPRAGLRKRWQVGNLERFGRIEVVASHSTEGCDVTLDPSLLSEDVTCVTFGPVALRTQRTTFKRFYCIVSGPGTVQLGGSTVETLTGVTHGGANLSHFDAKVVNLLTSTPVDTGTKN